MDGAMSLAIAVVGALLGGGAALLNTARQKSADAAVTRWQSELTHRQKQLNELYGPLTMLRSTSRSLRRLLPSQVNGSEWRLVHHIGDIRREWDRIKDDPALQVDPALGLTREQIEVVRLIVDYGTKTCALLDAHAGLVEGTPPGGIMKFQEHHNRLRASWETGSNQPVDLSLTFPGDRVGREEPDGVPLENKGPETDVDAAIEVGMAAVRTAHDELLAAGPGSSASRLGGVLLIAGLVGGIALAGFVAIDSMQQETRILVTTPDGVLCGRAEVGNDSKLLVGGRVVPPDSEVEFVDHCE